ncbi:unnamed protein product [Closterium sp. NIES-54]
MFLTLYFIVTRLPDSLRSVRDHFLSLDPTALTIDLHEQHLFAAETSIVAVGAAHGTPRTPFFEGCSPSPLAPSYASTAAVDIPGAEDVGAAFASAKRRSSKGKGGRGGGGDSGGGGGGSTGGGGGIGGGGSGGSGGGSGGFGGGGGSSGGGGGSGGSGSGGGRDGATQRGGSGGGQRQQQQRRSETLSPQQLREWFSQRGPSGGSGSCPYVIRTGDHAGKTCGKPHLQHRCFSRLNDAWCVEFGDEAKRPRWAELRRCGIAILDLDYDVILAAMYALFVSAEGDYYLCVPPDPGIEAAALGASESVLLGTAPTEALHAFTLDSGASRCFFRDNTTLTPLPTPVPVRLADPSGGPVLAPSSTVLPCPAVSASPPALSCPPCLPCIEGQQRAAPHSSSFPPTTSPLQTLHMDVWGPARVSGQGCECYFLLVVDDYTRYTTVFPLCSKCDVPDLLIPWIRAVRLQLRERFRQDVPVLRLHSDKGERRIGLVMEVARTSMIHAAAPHFLWPFAVRYVAHQLNRWPRLSLPETSPTLRWTGKVGDASVFRVWGFRAFVRDTSEDKLSARAIPCVFLGFVPDAPGWQFYHPTSRHVFLSQDFTFDESGPAPSGVSRVDPLHGTALVEVAAGSGAARGAASAGTACRGAEPGGAESEGDGSGGAEPGGIKLGGAESKGAESADTGAGGAGVPAGAGGTAGDAAAGLGCARTRGIGAAGTGGVGGAGAVDPTEPRAAAAGGAGVLVLELEALAREELELEELELLTLELEVLGVPSSTGLTPPLLCPSPDQSQLLLQPASPLPAPSPYTERTGGLTERLEPASRPASPVRTGRRVPRPRPPSVLGTHAMALHPSSVPLRVSLPPPSESSLRVSDRACAASPTVSRLLATVVTDPSFESTAACALVAELVDFAAASYLDHSFEARWIIHVWGFWSQVRLLVTGGAAGHRWGLLVTGGVAGHRWGCWSQVGLLVIGGGFWSQVGFLVTGGVAGAGAGARAWCWHDGARAVSKSAGAGCWRWCLVLAAGAGAGAWCWRLALVLVPSAGVTALELVLVLAAGAGASAWSVGLLAGGSAGGSDGGLADARTGGSAGRSVGESAGSFAGRLAGPLASLSAGSSADPSAGLRTRVLAGSRARLSAYELAGGSVGGIVGGSVDGLTDESVGVFAMGKMLRAVAGRCGFTSYERGT